MDNLYYRHSGASKRRSVKSRLRFLKYIQPFLLLVAIILVALILLKAWNFLSNLNGGSLDESAEIYVVQGQVQKMPYGETKYDSVLSGELLLDGDKIRTLKDGVLSLNFFDDTIVRLDSSTVLEIEDIEKSENAQSVHINVLAGQIWVNKRPSIKVDSEIVVNTNYLGVKGLSTVFSVKSGLPESVVVSDGSVLVSVHELNKSDSNIVEEIAINAGKSFEMDSVAYDSFLNRETPAVIRGINTQFKNSIWYQWNFEQDENPLSKPSSMLIGKSVDQDSTNDNVQSKDSVVSNGPKITYPKNGEVLDTEVVTITGEVPADAEKVIVISYDSEPPIPYVLKAYKAGDTTFKYIAKYDGEDGNMKKGKNKYEIFYVNEDGIESDKTVLDFTFDPDSSSINSKEVELKDAPEVSNELKPAQLLTINGATFANNYKLTENRGLIVGKIGTWAKSVVINGYKLQQYVPYSGEFVYILSEGFGTLQKGENNITITGYNDDGQKSQPVTFTVIVE